MRARSKRLVWTFHTTAEAMRMEALCKKAGVPGRLIPVPRQLSAGCGMAWAMDPDCYKTFSEEFLQSLPEPEATAELWV